MSTPTPDASAAPGRNLRLTDPGLQALHSTLAQAGGEPSAGELCFRMGRQWGRAEARQLGAQLPFPGPPDVATEARAWLARGLVRMDELGLSRLEVEQVHLDLQRKECALSMRMLDTAHAGRGPASADPHAGVLCELTSGYLCGFLAELTGLDVVCTPLSCQETCPTSGCKVQFEPAHANPPPRGAPAPAGSARFFLGSLGQGLGEADISLADLVENSADAMILIDQEDVIRYWNRGAETMFQYRADETVGRRIGFLVPPDLLESDELGRIRRKIEREGLLTNYVTRRIRKDGGERYVSLMRSLLHDSRGRVVGTTAVFRDVTEERRSQEELARARGLALVGELSANIAHDIKNSLTGIYAATQLLARGLAEGDARREIFEQVAQEVRRLDATAQDLLRFARSEPPRRQPTDFRQFLENLLGKLQTHPEVRPHQVELDLPERLALDVDPQLLQQAFTNLILNAAQAMDEPGRIGIRAVEHEQEIWIDVEDQGVGIPAENLASIFQPFFTTKSRGTGLGLPIAKKNVEIHGGQLEVQSRPGEGCRFRVRLPRMESDPLDFDPAS